MNRNVLSVLLLSISASPVLVAGQAPEAALTAVDAFHEALSTQHKEAALAHLAPDVLIFESGGAELSRDEYASHHLGADMEFSAATTRKVTDRQSGQAGEIAWVLTRSETTGMFRDNEINAAGVETMMLRQTTEGWKIFHIHWSSRTKKAD